MYDFKVETLVHNMSKADNDHLNIHYSTTMARLENVTHARMDEVRSLVSQIIGESMRSLELPGGDEARQRAANELEN